MSRQTLTITSAASGWRTVEALTGSMGPLEQLGDDDLFRVQAIACFALVEDRDGGETNRYVLPVRAEDWPAYLWVSGDESGHTIVDYLGPGEELTDLHREEARRMIAAARGEDAA